MNHVAVKDKSAVLNVNGRRVLDLFFSYLALTKPTISLLVVVTAIPVMLVAKPNFTPSVSLMLWTIVGTWLASASAATLNQFFDARIDSKMKRTALRPLPQKSLTSAGAVWFALVTLFASMFILVKFVQPMAAFVALAGHLFYVFGYTLFLKTRTTQNIVIGGAAGAIGPLIGWAAVGEPISAIPWLLFLLIFLWTPPHFWALALKYKDDYAAAGIPMLPVVKGEEYTRRHILFYTLSCYVPFIGLYFYGLRGVLFHVLSLGLTSFFLYYAINLYRKRTLASAMQMFHYSCLYLFGIFGALALQWVYDRVI